MGVQRCLEPLDIAPSQRASSESHRGKNGLQPTSDMIKVVEALNKGHQLAVCARVYQIELQNIPAVFIPGNKPTGHRLSPLGA